MLIADLAAYSVIISMALMCYTEQNLTQHLKSRIKGWIKRCKDELA